MAKPRKANKPAGKVAGGYKHPDKTLLMRPEGGTQAQFRKKKPAVTHRDRVLRLPLTDEARAATKIFREVPLAGNAAAGRAQGKADLLFERAGEWRVVEFRTDRLDGPDSLREYAAQLTGYSTSLAGVVGAEVKAAIFWFAVARSSSSGDQKDQDDGHNIASLTQ